MNRKFWLPPLFSSLIAYILLAIYFFFTNFDSHDVVHYLYNYVLGIFKIFPLVYLFLCIISYVLYGTIGYIILTIKNRYFLSTGVFWFLSFLIGASIGIVVATLIYYYKHSTGEAIWAFSSLSLGGLFSSSLYSVLAGEVKDPRTS